MVQAAAQLRAAAAPVREALYEVRAVHVRAELLRAQLSAEQSQRMEESFTRRRANLVEALSVLLAAGDALSQGSREGARWLDLARPRSDERKTAGLGLGAGIGIGFPIDVGGKDRIDSAQIAPGADGRAVVQVEHDRDTTPHLVVEAHYLFPLRRPRCTAQSCTPVRGERFRWGPFVAIQPGDDFVDAVGAGLLLGVSVNEWHRRGSVNVGLGYVADPNTRVLADGFRPGEPPPPGETQVRFKRVTQSGILVLLTYGF
jgi:hypothetical protein